MGVLKGAITIAIRCECVQKPLLSLEAHNPCREGGAGRIGLSAGLTVGMQPLPSLGSTQYLHLTLTPSLLGLVRQLAQQRGLPSPVRVTVLHHSKTLYE